MVIRSTEQAGMKAASERDGASGDSSQSLFEEFAVSSKNQGKNVYNALAQIADTAGVKLSRAELDKQNSAPMMSSHWWMQQAGSMAVTVPLIVLTHKGLGAAIGPSSTAAEGRAGEGLLKSALNSQSGRLGLTGAAYEGIFHASSEGESLLLGRSKNALQGGLSFYATGFVGSRTMTMLGATMAERELTASVLGRGMKNFLPGLGGGMAGGGTYGFVHANAVSIRENGRPADLQTNLDEIARGAVLGSALAGIGVIRADSTAPAAKASSEGAAVRSSGRANVKIEGSAEGLPGLKIDPTLDAVSQQALLNRAEVNVSSASRLAQTGKHGEAAEQYRQALEATVKVRGPEHPAVPNLLSQMARSDMFAGNYVRAVQAMDSAIAINAGRFGELSEPVASGFDQLSAIYQRAGDYGAAAQAMQKSLHTINEAHAQSRLLMSEAEVQAKQKSLTERAASLYDLSGDAARAQQLRSEMPGPVPVEPMPE